MAAPESTRSAGLQPNERVSLLRSFEFLNVVAVVRFGLTLAFPRLAAYRAIRGRRVARERRPRPLPTVNPPSFVRGDFVENFLGTAIA